MRTPPLWIGTDSGLRRFDGVRSTPWQPPTGTRLPSSDIRSLHAARDVRLWIGTTRGLASWKDDTLTRYPELVDVGLPVDSVHSLFGDSRGRLWVATPAGVAILASDRFLPVPSVPPGEVFSFTEDGTGAVWLTHRDGLFRLLDAQVVERIPWAKLGRAEPATALLRDDAQDGLWIGFRDRDVARFKEGRLTLAYATGEGFSGFHIDAKGTLWATAEGGLSRLDDGRTLTLTSRNGLPCDTVHWMMEDDADSVWLYMACVLVRTTRSELDAWASNPQSTIQATVFDRADGVRSMPRRRGSRFV